MDAALIENGVVVQVWRDLDHQEIRNIDDLHGEIIVFPDDTVVCGMLWDGASLTAPEPRPKPEPQAQVEPQAPIDLGPLADTLQLVRDELERIKQENVSLKARLDLAEEAIISAGTEP